MESDRTRSLPGLVADLFAQSSTLFRKEIQLAKAEMAEKVTEGFIGLGMMIGAAVLFISALNVLLAAAVTGLTEAGVPAWLSSIIVGVIVAIIGYVMLNRGMAALKTDNLMPKKTADQLAQDAALLKEQAQ
ncbi:phage holin family protein [Terrihabitans rhizophilus]|jgi:drug/metabolite transporter (DMT)-like permease|uniref:Phage holin family protein n=1 Tax=Terrihabitans rhizophilus TaxID=3092662 RepID=A0ABU4RQ73_9HYPH|nr:phage holin family protein [Terrihabitans sp. PJ23]MDX6806984.1 phage holin family protein [Terrihabitans sp. PJ23]